VIAVDSRCPDADPGVLLHLLHAFASDGTPLGTVHASLSGGKTKVAHELVARQLCWPEPADFFESRLRQAQPDLQTDGAQFLSMSIDISILESRLGWGC
jgi:hypothetical protein